MDKMSLIYKGTVPNLVCCEAILRELPNGEWVTFIQTGGPTEPHKDNNVFISRSNDRGVSWSKLVQLFDIPGKATYQTEAMVYDNNITLFVTTHNGKFLDWQTWYTTSQDNCYTWTKLKPISFLPENTFVRNLYIKKNGDLLLPFQHYHIEKQEIEELKKNDMFVMKSASAIPENGVFLSKDKGKTWTCNGGIKIKAPNWIWAENNVVELSDGTIAMLIRVDKSGYLFRADSKDGGISWGEPYKTDIQNASSKVRLFKLKDERIALIHNPAPYVPEKHLASRNPLSLWISDNNMESWSYKRDIVTFPGALSYPDGFVDEEEGYIHFAFDYNKHDTIYVGAKI